jgi:pantoate--beta-alanine ligase
MGYLHEGHLSLVRRAKKDNDIVVVSIFVNPLQFGPEEDFKRYPRDLRRDKRLLKKTGARLLFLPQAGALYGQDFETEVRVKNLSRNLCGRTRPVHFAGVATVVAKLLNIVAPHNLYLGLKDYQQFRVVSQMVKDLNMPVKVIGCQIVRESDGLAMSSRNVFLSAAERRSAVSIYRALRHVRSLVQGGERSSAVLISALRKTIQATRDSRVDYAEIVDAATLCPVVQLKSKQSVLAALAVFFRKTRLIDNCVIKVT